MELKNCKFSLIRYVPDPVREEYINIGVVLEEVDTENPHFAVRVTRNWARVLRLDPDANTNLLGMIEEEFRQRFNATGRAGESVLASLREQLSNSLQVTTSLEVSSMKGVRTEDPGREIERLMQLYVEDKVAKPEAEDGNTGPLAG